MAAPCWLSLYYPLMHTGKGLLRRSKQVLLVSLMDIPCDVSGGDLKETIPLPGVMQRKIIIIQLEPA